MRRLIGRLGVFVLLYYFSCSPAHEIALPPAKYVGDSTCATCHADIYQAYRRTWKAHSLSPAHASQGFIEDFSQPPVYDSHRNFYYRAVQEGDSLYIYEWRLQGKDTLYLRREKIDFIIGSGHQTRSYLLWRNGFLYEAPITWYARVRRWGLSPGYDEGKNSRFSREIQPACLFCHASGWQPIPYTYNRYTRIGGAIGCESCHGPGSYHVQNPQDTTYFWSKWQPLRQMDVCSRCHLEGITVEKRQGWKPGDTLSAYYAIFLPERAELGSFGIASHAERLLRSACFQKGKLTCTSCHHPHPIQAVPSYEQRCLSCHKQGCRNPAHSSGGCIGCHMPKGTSSDIPHTTFTDHYIRVVRRGETKPLLRPKLLCATEPHPDSAWIAEAYLKWYSQEKTEPWVLETLSHFPPQYLKDGVKAQFLLLQGQAAQALPYAQRAIQRDSSLLMREIYGLLLESAGKKEEAFTVWRELMRDAPAYPEASFRYVLLGYELGRISTEHAYHLLDSLCQVQPWNPQFHYNAAFFAAQLGRSQEACGHLEAALRAEPDYKPAASTHGKICSLTLR